MCLDSLNLLYKLTAGFRCAVCIIMRNRLRISLLLLVLIPIVLAGSYSQARAVSSIEHCLNNPKNLTQECAKKFISHQSISQCYKAADTIFSTHSKENLKNYCFYNVSEFPTLNSCTTAALKFFIAENKDQALFECYRQFASGVSENNCIKISKLMTFTEKKTYLENHCHNL